MLHGELEFMKKTWELHYDDNDEKILYAGNEIIKIRASYLS